MKKKITRQDEKKLFEAYETLDKILNGHSIVNDLVKEKMEKLFRKLERMLMHIVDEIYQCKVYNYRQAASLQATFNKWFEDLEKEYLEIK